MPNGLARLFSRQRAVDSPTFQCPLQKAVIQVETYSHHPDDRLQERQPEGGIEVRAAGLSAPSPGKTTAGRWRFKPVPAPNSYTVSYLLTPKQQAVFDHANTQNGIAKPMAGGQTEQWLFEFPFFWVEYLIHDSLAQPLAQVSWRLDHQPPGGAFDKLERGETAADGRLYRPRIERGRYKLDLHTLANPGWSTPNVVIGESTQLSADLTGEDDEVQGHFDIMDANALGAGVHRLRARVEGGNRLVADWTPSESQCAGLRSANIAFRAEYGRAKLYSAPIVLVKKQPVRAKDPTGANVQPLVDFHFSGGGHLQLNLAGGSGVLEVPWTESVIRIGFPHEDDLLVEVKGAANAKRHLHLPALNDAT